MITTNIIDSDRHRPDRLATDVTDDQTFVGEYLAQAVADGMDPAEVARIVAAALHADQFLILTHDSYPQQLVDRVEALVARRLPAVPSSPEPWSPWWP